jgi:hypothetical protein
MMHNCPLVLFLLYFTIGRGNTKKTFVFFSSMLCESPLSSAHPMRGVRMLIPAVGWICVLANFLAPHYFPQIHQNWGGVSWTLAKTMLGVIVF